MKKYLILVTILQFMVITSFLIMCLFSCGGSETAKNAKPEIEVSEENTTISAEGGSIRFDNDTELQTTIQGLSLKDVYIVDDNNKKISSSEIALNSKFFIVYEGVKNLVLKNGKAFPELNIQVSDPNQNMAISETDVLSSDPDGLSEEEASTIRAMFSIAEPMQPGNYICSVQIMDKNNTESFIMSTWSCEVK
jgi:hypothetical protein